MLNRYDFVSSRFGISGPNTSRNDKNIPCSPHFHLSWQFCRTKKFRHPRTPTQYIHPSYTPVSPWSYANLKQLLFSFVLLLQVFVANTSPARAEITLDEYGILTQLVRIYPINCARWKEAGVDYQCCFACLLRFEIFGCC